MQINLKTPFVSVLVPNYNHAAFLTERLKSISEQTYEDIEIIILDDASSDGSVDLLREFGALDEHVSFSVFNSINTGRPVAQWAAGVSLARGKYVWIAESDDSCHPKFLATLVNALENRENVGIAYCGSLLIDRSSNVLGTFSIQSPLFPQNLWEDDFLLEGKRLIPDYFSVRNIIPNASAALFRRDLLKLQFEKVSSFDVAADWAIYIYMLLENNLLYVNENLNSHRIHNNNLTRVFDEEKDRKMLREKLKILRILIDNFGLSDGIQRALNSIFRNRHKFKRVGLALSKIRNLDSDVKFFIYGYNDISRYIIETEKSLNILGIIDRAMCGNSFNEVPVLSIDNVDLKAADGILIASLNFAAEMVATLHEVGFEGEIIRV